MIFKRWKSVYIVAFVKILVATWNISDQCEENNFEKYDVNHFFYQDSAVPEHSKLESSENEIRNRNHNTYNNSMIRESNNGAETPNFQHSSTIPEYTELLPPCEIEMHDCGTHNNSMMWESYDTETPRFQHSSTIPEYTKLHLPCEIEMSNHDYGYNTYNDPMVMRRSHDSIIRTNNEPEEKIDQEGIKIPIIEQLMTGNEQMEQNLGSGMQQATDEHSRRIDESIDGQEAVELNTSVDNLEDMPILEPIEEHRPYDMEEEFHSSVIPQSAKDSSYEYLNSAFLFNFLYFPSPLITAGSIRVRFGAHFLSFLTSSQLIRVLIVLLENKLELSNEDQKEFIETIFGHIDYSLKLVITKELVVKLVKAMMKSNVPDYFEYVFLTWKMWYSFTIEEQEKMLKYVKREYKREILVMLYLFVVNRDGINSQQCEIFKNDIKNQYREISIFKNVYSLEELITEGDVQNSKIISTILDTFDTCLLDIPRAFKSLNNNIIIAFRDFFRKCLFVQNPNTRIKILRYKSHVCYAFTKFTPELKQTNDGETNSRLYLNPVYIKCQFENWIRMLKYDSSYDKEVSAVERKNEFVNAFGMIRQIVQSNDYNSNVLYKLFNKLSSSQAQDEQYLILLFSLTNKNILKEFTKNKEWTQEIKTKLGAASEYNFIKNIYMNNAGFDSKDCVVGIHEVLSVLNEEKYVKMRREHYFYRRLLLHPRLNVFKDEHIPGYIQGLNEIGWLNSKEQCDQLARDLIFNIYYHKGVLEFLRIPKESIKEQPGALRLQDCIERQYEVYKKNGGIKKEVHLFRTH
ncbi:hypothetical protein PAEPH01_0925 [Pancytospora epiphaga]|nr:hypothetical protein PAEPH01_0925 [Pancytospora epiphaga]